MDDLLNTLGGALDSNMEQSGKNNDSSSYTFNRHSYSSFSKNNQFYSGKANGAEKDDTNNNSDQTPSAMIQKLVSPLLEELTQTSDTESGPSANSGRFRLPLGYTGTYVEVTDTGVDIGMRGEKGNSSFLKLNLSDSSRSQHNSSNHQNNSSNHQNHDFNKEGRRTDIRGNIGGAIGANLQGRIEEGKDGPNASIDLSFNKNRPHSNDKYNANQDINYSFDLTDHDGSNESRRQANIVVSLDELRRRRDRRKSRVYTNSDSDSLLDLDSTSESPKPATTTHLYDIKRLYYKRGLYNSRRQSSVNKKLSNENVRKYNSSSTEQVDSLYSALQGNQKNNRCKEDCDSTRTINRSISKHSRSQNDKIDPMSALIAGTNNEENHSSGSLMNILEINNENKGERNCDVFPNESKTDIMSSPWLGDLNIEDIPFEDEDRKSYDNKIVYGDDKIEGSYYNDLDIITIDRIICRKINQESIKIHQLWKDIQTIDEQLRRCPHDQNLKKRIKTLEKEMTIIQNGTRLKEYQKQALPLLEEYKKVRINQVSEFGQETIMKPSKECLNVIYRYIKLASSYIEINLVRSNDADDKCNNCGDDLESCHPDLEGKLKCSSCGTETIPLQREIINNDTNSIPGKSGYEDIKTFKKAIECYMCAQQVTFSDDLIHKLDEYFISHKNMPPGHVIREMPLIGTFAGRRKRGNTSRSLMIDALQNTDNSDYYQDCNLLCCTYWGWESPDLSGVYDRIIDDYKVIQPVYNVLKERYGRKSSIGRGYRLFRQLWHISYPCHPSEFGIAQTEEILDFYESIWQEICNIKGEELGWRPFVSVRKLMMTDPDTLE